MESVVQNDESPKRRYMLYVLTILYGFAGWMGANAVFLQLPIIINDAPEAWRLPSFVVLIVQSGNIGPLLYTLLQKWRPVNDAYLIYGLLVLANIACILFAFFYNETTVIFGQEMSLALFLLTFCFAIVACTSSTLFMPYMGRFLERYMITYLIGQGLAGFISSLITLGQGSSSSGACVPSNSSASGWEQETIPPLFSVRTFFLITFVMYLISTAAFIVINEVEMFRKEYAQVTIKYGNDYTFNKRDENSLIGTQEQPRIISKYNYRYLIALTGILSVFCNAVLPSIQSFSTLPYGNAAYHFSVVFSLMANPIADLVGFFVPNRTIKLINSLVTVISIPAIYIFVISLMSPSPPLMGNIMGAVLTIACWTIYTGMYSFINLSIISVFRAQGGKSLVYMGGTAQIGSFSGSVLFFFIVNFTNIFKSFDPCAGMNDFNPE